MVNASNAEVIAPFSWKRTGSSSASVEKSRPVQPDISASAPSSLTWARHSASFSSACARVRPVITVIMVKTTISRGSRPVAAARRRMSATMGAITRFDGPLMNTHSACSAANCLPLDEAPA